MRSSRQSERTCTGMHSSQTLIFHLLHNRVPLALVYLFSLTSSLRSRALSLSLSLTILGILSPIHKHIHELSRAHVAMLTPIIGFRVRVNQFKFRLKFNKYPVMPVKPAHSSTRICEWADAVAAAIASTDTFVVLIPVLLLSLTMMMNLN